MRHFLSTPACHPSASPNARQKCGSSKGSCTSATQVESLSFRVQGEHARFAPASSVSIPSDPLLWYPPAAACWSTSAMVMVFLRFPSRGMEEKSLILHGYLKR